MPPSLLALLQRVAAAEQVRLALVGGAVRDLLLHRVHNDPWRGLPDLDLVAETVIPDDRTDPPALRLAQALHRALPAAGSVRSQEHGAFGTVELELRLPEGPWLLDLASARQESYLQPGENPIVRLGRVEDDLARRDFTINAMALLVAPEAEAGELRDPFGGRIDLERRQLRFLHERSVQDDPTRVLRGARYAARLGFQLAPASREQLRRTLAAWPWEWKVGDPAGTAPPALGTRLRMELVLLLEREDWRTGLAVLQEWGALTLLDATLQRDRFWRQRLHWALRLGLPLLPVLLAGAADPLALAERLQVAHRHHRLLARFLTLRQRLDALGSQWLDWTPSRWSAFLEAAGGSADAVALGVAAGWQPRRPLLRWWLRWRHLRATETAADLIARGWRPGPALGQELLALRDQRLDDERG